MSKNDQHFAQHRTREPILAAKSAEDDPKMAPQDDPKSIKNGVQQMIKILIDFKTAGPRFLGRPGGMRRPPGKPLKGLEGSESEL